MVRSFGQDYIERVRAYQSTSAYQKAVRKRQVWVEPLFAEGKQWHQMRRFRLRRLWRVNTEAFLIAAGQNLKRLLQRRGWGRRPFPSGRAVATDEGVSRLLSFCFLFGVSQSACRSQLRDRSEWMSRRHGKQYGISNRSDFFNTLDPFTDILLFCLIFLPHR